MLSSFFMVSGSDGAVIARLLRKRPFNLIEVIAEAPGRDAEERHLAGIPPILDCPGRNFEMGGKVFACEESWLWNGEVARLHALSGLQESLQEKK